MRFGGTVLLDAEGLSAARGDYMGCKSSVDIVLYLLQRIAGYNFQRLVELSIAMVSCFLVFKYLVEMHHRSLIS